MSRSLPYHLRCLIVSTSMNVSTPEGLANHAESVSCYLHEYGRTGDRTMRSKYSGSFFLYLLAASWRKQHSRFCSWRTFGFIQELEKSIGRIAEQAEEYWDSCDSCPFPEELGRGDRTLAEFYSKNKKYLCHMMTDTSKSLPPPIQSQLLEQVNSSPSGSEDANNNAFGEAVEHALKEKKPLYTKETAVTFHCLLYLSFIMAGRALRAIKDSYQDLPSCSSKMTEERAAMVDEYKTMISAAELPIRFLICLLSSTSFNSHMSVWTLDGAYIRHILPKYEKKAEYVEFGKIRKILGKLKQGPQVSSEDSEFDLEDEMTEVREPFC